MNQFLVGARIGHLDLVPLRDEVAQLGRILSSKTPGMDGCDFADLES